MRKFFILPFLLLLSITLLFTIDQIATKGDFKESDMDNNSTTRISLTNPRFTGEISLEKSISQRRSVRSYSGESVSFDEVSQILWAAHGITDDTNELRAAPSAGALYPLSTYVAVSNVENITPGVYRYSPKDHEIQLVRRGDVNKEIYENALMQPATVESALIVIFAADYGITKARYGGRAERYVHMEAGHAGQNLYLQAETLGLGTVAIGAFDDKGIAKATGIIEGETPLYLFPVGNK